MSDFINDYMKDVFEGHKKSQDPLGEADKAIKQIQELNKKIQKGQKQIIELTAKCAYLATKAPEPSPIGKKVDRILGILNRLESQGTMSKEDIRGLRVQVEGLINAGV